jgi:hypothetical protein
VNTENIGFDLESQFNQEILALNSYIYETPDRKLWNFLSFQINNTRFADELKSIISSTIEQGADINNVIRDSYISAEKFKFYEDIFFKYLNNDNLMYVIVQIIDEIVLNSSEDLAPEDRKYIIDLLIKSTDKGADINFFLEGATLLEIVLDKEVADFIKSKGGKCNNLVFKQMESLSKDMIANPSDMLKAKYKNLDAVESKEAKIPYILHQIWLTHQDSPREISKEDIKIVLDTKATFDKAPVHWEHIVWTNNKGLIPNSTSLLEDAGIKVQSIYEYRDNIASFDIIESLIGEKKWGMASDTLRYSLVKYMGGVYGDLNFIFNRDLTSETHKYNFFSKTYGSFYIDNFFFGASPNHPIIENIVSTVEANLLKFPDYMLSVDNSARVVTDMLTANPTYIGYYNASNKNGNIDVIYPTTVSDHSDIVESSVNEELLSRMMYNCPEEAKFIELLFYFAANEFCGDQVFDIGYDTPDGLTWLHQ